MIGPDGKNLQGVRSDRMADLIKQEVADILTKKVRDPRIGFVTVTGVDISRDFRNASIYVCFQEKQDDKKGIAALKKAAGFVRGELARRLSLRRMPALTFVMDQVTEKVSHLLGVIESLHVQPEADPQENRPEPNMPLEGLG